MTDQEITTEVKTQPEKVTAPPSQKVKNPKRVAAGKRLAALNKERLEKLKNSEQQTTPRADEPSAEPPNEPNASYHLNKTDQQYLWLAGGLFITVGLGYAIARLTSEQRPQPTPPQSQPPPPPPAKKITVEDDF